MSLVFSWSEEELAQRGEAVPFGLQDNPKERGGKVHPRRQAVLDTYVVENGRLITGQSSRGRALQCQGRRESCRQAGVG